MIIRLQKLENQKLISTERAQQNAVEKIDQYSMVVSQRGPTAIHATVIRHGNFEKDMAAVKNTGVEAEKNREPRPRNRPE